MNEKLDNILFLDIETVPQYKNFREMPEDLSRLWTEKTRNMVKDDETPEKMYNCAGIWAEFGKIICISVGFIYNKNGKNIFRTKSFYGSNEETLLHDFCNDLNKFTYKRNVLLCAHNGKEFDFPYIARRMLANSIKLPKILDVGGKKPWEVPFLDTMELWRFGDYKNYTSLNLMAKTLGIESPKDDIDGSMVADVYYKQNNIERIVKYCEKDTVTVAKLYLKLKGLFEIVLEND